jgi:hypothetical protein
MWRCGGLITGTTAAAPFIFFIAPGRAFTAHYYTAGNYLQQQHSSKKL